MNAEIYFQGLSNKYQSYFKKLCSVSLSLLLIAPISKTIISLRNDISFNVLKEAGNNLGEPYCHQMDGMVVVKFKNIEYQEIEKQYDIGDQVCINSINDLNF